jgi:hypothetical protein
MSKDLFILNAEVWISREKALYFVKKLSQFHSTISEEYLTPERLSLFVSLLQKLTSSTDADFKIQLNTSEYYSLRELE